MSTPLHVTGPAGVRWQVRDVVAPDQRIARPGRRAAFCRLFLPAGWREGDPVVAVWVGCDAFGDLRYGDPRDVRDATLRAQLARAVQDGPEAHAATFAASALKGAIARHRT